MSEWRPIETAPMYEDVLVYDPRFRKALYAHKDGSDYWYIKYTGQTLQPTHWMKLPEPPR